MAFRVVKQEAWVRVYPEYGNNWASDRPFSLELKLLGQKASARYMNRLRGDFTPGFRTPAGQKPDPMDEVIKESLRANIRDGSIQNWEDPDGNPRADLSYFLETAPMPLLIELGGIHNDLSSLRAVSEEEWKKYVDGRKASGEEVSPRTEEREKLSEDEQANLGSVSGGPSPTPGS